MKLGCGSGPTAGGVSGRGEAHRSDGVPDGTIAADLGEPPAEPADEPTTGKFYRGGNVLGLNIDGMQKGYDANRWSRNKQAAEKGWQVRKGEAGSRIEFCEVKPGRAGPDVDPEKLPRLVLFNGQQIEGLPYAPPARRGSGMRGDVNTAGGLGRGLEVFYAPAARRRTAP